MHANTPPLHLLRHSQQRRQTPNAMKSPPLDRLQRVTRGMSQKIQLGIGKQALSRFSLDKLHHTPYSVFLRRCPTPPIPFPSNDTSKRCSTLFSPTLTRTSHGQSTKLFIPISDGIYTTACIARSFDFKSIKQTHNPSPAGSWSCWNSPRSARCHSKGLVDRL